MGFGQEVSRVLDQWRQWRPKVRYALRAAPKRSTHFTTSRFLTSRHSDGAEGLPPEYHHCCYVALCRGGYLPGRMMKAVRFTSPAQILSCRCSTVVSSQASTSHQRQTVGHQRASNGQCGAFY